MARDWVERVNRYKSSLGCYFCGVKDARCLDFHHIDPAQKSFDISAAVRRKIPMVEWWQIEQEISKCRVLCANDHRISTMSMRAHRRARLNENQLRLW